MPELPEVETVMRGLSPSLQGNKIAKIKLNRKDLRIPFPLNMQARLKGRLIQSLTRRAKYILINFEGGVILSIHLGMSGRISILPTAQKYTPETHDHMIITLQDGVRVIYNDPRRFGMVFILQQDELQTHKAFCHLGPEPLSNHFSSTYLIDCFKHKKTSIKQALLDQRVVVGVGNIYACEALFESGVSPVKPAHKLKQKEIEKLVVVIRDVLSRAIKSGGSTLKDYRHTNGDLGYFQHNFQVYDRQGQACSGCDCDIQRTKGIQRIIQSSRSTFYCPRKQK